MMMIHMMNSILPEEEEKNRTKKAHVQKKKQDPDFFPLPDRPTNNSSSYITTCIFHPPLL